MRYLSKILLFTIILSSLNGQSHLKIFHEAEAQTKKNMEEVIIEVKPNYYMIQPKGAVAGNIGVFVSDDGLILVDDQWEVTKKHVIKALRKISQKKIKYIINTHFHYDHVDGNKAFAKMRIPIVAHKNVRLMLKNDHTLDIPSGIIQPKHPKEALPTLTFEKGLDIHESGETISIYHFGPAHTNGDAVIQFNEANILHTGDLFVTYGFPFIDFNSGGNLPGLIHTLNKIIELSNDETIIMPGHGNLCNKNDVIGLRDKLVISLDAIKQGKANGKSIEEILENFPIDIGGFKEVTVRRTYQALE